MNTIVIVILSLAVAFAIVGFLILKGAIKVPIEKKDQYAKISFGSSLILLAASVLAYFFPAIRAKLDEHKKVSPSTSKVR